MSLAYDAILARDGAARLRRAAIAAAVAAVVITAMAATGLLDPARFADAWPAVVQLSREMFPPDFGRFPGWLRPLADTLAMSIAGTAIAVGLSLPLALAAAGNTTPNRAVYHVARLVLNLLRSIPELIMGIILVAMVGFGALPGVLALGLHSVGMVGKFFAESIEHVDPKPVEAARAAGATTPQVVWHAVVAQVMPQLADTTIYRWEYNFRASTVLGAVGAGGIGFELIAALRVLDYAQVSAILICMLACVTLVDGLGAALRRGLK
ncbi:phosphonate ABC transporter, permease protein PhnE [Rhodoplanes sp. TEM]|uniref:Phosphonate ABC transporter, permease protein PhnE n=1 Tax=Rhodoplanes tepidamans TaxID=200616 RepID=A0ABT5JFJ6_RHOTP|nr:MULTISPECIES: phosphonate ABC transporter, permease protein PhnE [Rhodoplanes]MDC7788446.1 phosphonate ABC transporter, permease protein PhnE [Rhodoplanes tepidamans]MDC7983591.1 phosphonate ABC transporter, permease protein PhnE [Rhodoplanes sp. TEM]MDQ0354167.1 phosphonate transport system permease protein [Rhodoplanes tepidamans]